MSLIRYFFILSMTAMTLSAFQTANLQLLYGSFDDNTYFDTQDHGKATLTAEYYTAKAFGDLFCFADYEFAGDGFFFSPDEQQNLYLELSPRVDFSYISGQVLAFGPVRKLYAAVQYNRQIMHNTPDFHAYLYGIGTDLNVPGFIVFGLNAYKKNQNVSKHTYQLSTNYLSRNFFDTPFFITGFIDWTTIDFLSQNQLLYDFGTALSSDSSLQAGTEWHYYRVKDTPMTSSSWQFLLKVVW